MELIEWLEMIESADFLNCTSIEWLNFLCLINWFACIFCTRKFTHVQLNEGFKNISIIILYWGKEVQDTWDIGNPVHSVISASFLHVQILLKFVNSEVTDEIKEFAW